MDIEEKCLFCSSEDIMFSVEFQPANVTHSFCAFHAGVIQALEELFKNPKITWKRIEIVH